jgi:methanogenic corrinoid protein MtbC1
MSKELTEAMVELREDDALTIADRLLEEGADPLGILADCKRAMDVIGERFACGDAFIPELIMAGEIMQAITGKLKPHLADGPDPTKHGVIVLGTVEGDIHDIGKNIVAKFIDTAREKRAQVIAMSCLLTSAIASMKRTVAAAGAAGLRGDVRLMIGGAPITEQVVAYTGADGWGKDAVAAVDLAGQWLGGA